jgi:hypothetical protein
MASTDARSIRKWRTSLVVLLSALWAITQSSGSLGAVLVAQALQEHQEREPARPRNSGKMFSLTVIVSGDQQPSELPVKGATVTMFVGDHRESNTTSDNGRVTFKFTTTARTATIRVVAEHWEPNQQQVELDTGDKEHKVVLKAATE